VTAAEFGSGFGSEFGLIRSRTLIGVRGVAVDVEAQLLNGLPKFTIVGLPEAAVRESRDRIRGALKASGIDFPQRAIVINLAPADLPKQGGRFDLPIALAILLAMGHLEAARCDAFEFIGELSLAGKLRAVDGALPTAMSVAATEFATEAATELLTHKSGTHNEQMRPRLVLPADSAYEAALCETCEVYPANTLIQIIAGLSGTGKLSPLHPDLPENNAAKHLTVSDLADVKGQLPARRALEVACAGRHNLLMVGPPGTGKSMLATRAAGLLPIMTLQEASETASVQSISQQGFQLCNWRIRPVRSPHHTSSGIALVGGGNKPRPGEISLAHNGILFLDELAEFPRAVLDVLREPLEAGRVTISRAGRSADFPARFQLIAAMNPCPCGHAGDPQVACRCSEEQIRRYLSRLSGPFLDRIDMQVGVPRMSVSAVAKAEAGEGSALVAKRVAAAAHIQLDRQGHSNANLGGRLLEEVCALDSEAEKTLTQATDKLNLSLRAHHRVMRVARTIADLGGCESVSATHILEAVSYRRSSLLD